MEPFFEINAKHFDVFLPTIMNQLRLQDENLQLINIESILKCLKSEEGLNREAFLTKLIESEVISTLLNILLSLNNHLLPRIQQLLTLASKHQVFYQNKVAKDAIQTLIKISSCLVKRAVEGAPLLKQSILTISDILKNGLAFGISLYVMCIPKRLLLLVQMIYESKKDKSVMLLSTQLLNIILANVSIHEGLDTEIFDRCHEALKLTREAMTYQEDSTSVIYELKTLCATCAFGSRYYAIETSQYDTLSEGIQQRKESLAKTIYTALTFSIVPRFRDLKLSEDDSAEFQSNLVVSLSALYSVEYWNLEKLSNHLNTYGYLKYFLRSSVNCSPNLRQNTCTLLSQVLWNLDGKGTSDSQRRDRSSEFSNAVQELLSLPTNPNHWFLPTVERINTNMTVMALIYYHYQGTRETDMISFQYLIAKLESFPEQERISMRGLKIVWFLFAVAYTKEQLASSVIKYGSAIMRLISELKQSNLSECYTHHIDLMRFCFDCTEFPEDLQRTVLRLWLIECDGDIKPLLQLNSDIILQHFLYIALCTDHQDSRLTSPVQVIHQLINANNVLALTSITWEALPKLLSDYHPSKNERLTVLLELTVQSKTSTLQMSIIEDTAAIIVNIVLRKIPDNKLKTLLIMQARVLLEESVTRDAVEVLKMYIDAYDFLMALWNEAFEFEDLELAAECLRLLILILQDQQRFDILCEQPAEVKVENLTYLFYQTRNTPRVRSNVLRFLIESLKEKDGELAIRFANITSDSESTDAIFNLYEVLNMLIGRGDVQEMNLLYQCQLALFEYCDRKLKNLMCHLCTMLTTCSVVNYILEVGTVTSDFVYFVAGWLNYRKKYTMGPWNLSSPVKTPFEEALDNIKEYMANVDSNRLDDAHSKLRYALL